MTCYHGARPCSWYVANFNSYNQTYGSLGAVIAFMVSIWISASIILLGAELNAELDRPNGRDSNTRTEEFGSCRKAVG